MQTQIELEQFYQEPDPWGYYSNPWDALRKDIIVTTARRYTPIGARVLDIGCGEGFITRDLPGLEIFGIELSNSAAGRLPDKVRRIPEPSTYKKYHTVLACGVLYEQYDHGQMRGWIERSVAPGGHVITCHIMDWEVNELPGDKQIEVRAFPYRQYVQVLRVYKW